MTEKKVLAWHGDPDLKENTILRMKDHAEQDRFIRGTYMALEGEYDELTSEWGGCLHGCLTAENLAVEKKVSMVEFYLRHEPDVNWHAETQRFFGIDQSIGSALDHAYEKEWDTPSADVAIQLLEAIPVGADLDNIDLYDDEGDLLPLSEILEILRNAPVPNQEEGQ